MPEYTDKKQAGKKMAAAGKILQGKAAASLEDNRPGTTRPQKKTGESLTGENNPEPVQQKENATGLPDNLKSGIENLSGHSLDDVNVHYNSSKPAQLHAHAYAQGTDIHIAPGQEKQLPHEAWHVVQQKQGRVKPTTQLKQNVNINDDKTLEKKAGVMGTKALHRATSFVPAISTFVPAAGTVQSKKVAQLAKTVSGHGRLRTEGKKRKTFKVPGGRSIMRSVPPGATLGDMSMLLNTMKYPTRNRLMARMKVSTNSELWSNKNAVRMIKANGNYKTAMQKAALEKLDQGRVPFAKLSGGEKRSLAHLESKQWFEDWAYTYVSEHTFKTFKSGQVMDDMVLTPFEDKLRSNEENDMNEYVEQETILSDYLHKNPANDFIVNACSYHPNAEFTGFQIDEKK